MKKWKLYSIIVLTVSFLLAGAYYFFFPEKNSISYTVLAAIYMWIPGITAIIMNFKESKKVSEIGFKFNFNKWYLFSWLVFPLIIALSILINTFFESVRFNIYMTEFLESYSALLENSAQYEQMREMIMNQPWLPLLITVASGLIAGVTINFVFAIGEELGWRGYLYEKLKYLGFWKMSALIGFIWGLWHAPLILQGHNYPEYPVYGVFMMIAWCMLLTPLFNFIRIKSNSVVPAGIAHGTLNALGGLSIIYIEGGHPLLNGITGLSGFIALALVNFLIWNAVRKKPLD